MDGVSPAADEHGLFHALQVAIATADPAKREALATTIEAYARDFPDVLCWAIGEQSPILLHQLLSAIDAGCRPSQRPLLAICTSERKPRPAPSSSQLGSAKRAGALAGSGQVNATYGLPELW